MEKDVKKKQRAWDRTKEYKELRQDLLQGLLDAEMDQPRYRDLVDEYMICWCQVKTLNADIQSRGTRVEYRNGDQTGVTDNKSLGIKIRLLKTMADIFRQLGYQDEAKMKRNTVKLPTDGADNDEM